MKHSSVQNALTEIGIALCQGWQIQNIFRYLGIVIFANIHFLNQWLKRFFAVSCHDQGVLEQVIGRVLGLQIEGLFTQGYCRIRIQN